MLDVSPALPSLRAMQIKLSKSVAAIFAGIVSARTALAHPGHAPADTVAQISSPLAGADHFVAFLACTTILLLSLRALLKHRAAKMQKARK